MIEVNNPQRDHIIEGIGGMMPESTGKNHYLHNPDSTPMEPVVTFNNEYGGIPIADYPDPKPKRKIRPRVLKEDHDRTVSFLRKAAIVMTIIAAIGWVGFIYLLAKLIYDL